MRDAARPTRGVRVPPSTLLRLLMRRLFVAPRAVLLPLGPLGMLPPVLGREIVPALTGGAFHDDVLPRHLWVLRCPSSVIRRSGALRTTDNGRRMTAYFKIFVTTPAPTARPPSRIANRSCSSIAIGVISSIVIFLLSPGLTISTPAGSSPPPATSPLPRPHSRRSPLYHGGCPAPSS